MMEFGDFYPMVPSSPKKLRMDLDLPTVAEPKSPSHDIGLIGFEVVYTFIPKRIFKFKIIKPM